MTTESTYIKLIVAKHELNSKDQIVGFQVAGDHIRYVLDLGIQGSPLFDVPISEFVADMEKAKADKAKALHQKQAEKEAQELAEQTAKAIADERQKIESEKKKAVEEKKKSTSARARKAAKTE